MAFNENEFVKNFSSLPATQSGSFDINSFVSKYAPAQRDLNTVEGLAGKGRDIGLEDQVNTILDGKPRLSFLQRLSAGLGAFNPAEALLTGSEKGVGEGVKKYFTGVAGGIGSALTGNDYVGDRRTFADVAEKLGVTNSIAKFGIGVLGDVFLDPSTYFGGALAKGLLKGGEIGADLALKGVGKFSPELESASRAFGGAAKGAFGKAFVYGYGTSKGLTEQALEYSTNLSKVKEGIVSSNIERLGTGTLAPSQQQELVAKLLAGKRAEFEAGRATDAGRAAATGAARSTDPLVQKTIEEQAARSQKFARQAGIDDPFEIYFPGLKNDSIKNFFEGTRALRVGSEGYLKEFKNLLTDEQLIKNPAEAFSKVEFNIAKNNIVRDQLRKVVSDFGKPMDAFKTEEEAAKAGYSIAREGGIYGKPVGWITKADSKFLDHLIDPGITTIDALAKATGYDALTSLFKRSVTGLFAPFHVRNFVSGMIQNFEVLGVDALNPRNIAMGQKIAYKLAKGEAFPSQVLKVGDKTLNMAKLMTAFEKRFGTSSSYISDIADATKGSGVAPGKILSKESFKETGKTLGLGQQAIPFRAARAVGTFIETQQKATAYITALQQGKNIQEALGLASKAGFDYRAVTPFESQVLKRIIPFYSFTRKNVELQLRTLGEHPERINQVLATIRNVGDQPSEEEKKNLPDYIKESLAIKLKDTPDGLKSFIYGFGTPIEQFASLFKGISAPTFQKRVEGFVLGQISTMNPYLKVPIELGIGKDSFRQQDLKDVYDAKEYSSAPQLVKDLLQITPVQKPILEKNAQGKLVKTGERTQYVADPTRLLVARSLFTSRGISYLDQAFDGDLGGLSKALKLSTGVKPQSVDLTVTQSIKERDQKRELQDLLTRYGAVSQYSRVYEPKK